ncbi:MAG: glycosyl hydrolase 115 family protein [Verrucomicrobiota bacterium JB022]|nr:glycosyl hydrolase 115 family protein [Verrucomicrobiota bacterium JB022]
MYPYPRILLLVLCMLASLLHANPYQTVAPGADAFALIQGGRAVPLALGASTPPQVRRAAEDLAQDIERVTGQRPQILDLEAVGQKPALVVKLAEKGSALQGQWEAFTIGAEGQQLVITGSDMRGAIFGIYEVSQAIGVSPWHWWDDVPVARNPEVALPRALHRQGSPSVKYRGIFINDEDWGLHPWAAHTFDPELGDIGPKTYERVFELLLRLKANTLWPAMHEVTKAFNLYPENARLADAYGIVMGSSHAEPMLRNNVTEWTLPHSHFNYATHAEAVRDYWEGRAEANGGYENIYTLGMRGIHDSGMTAGRDTSEKVATLEKIISDQRDILRRHVSEDVEQVPQVFTPYKEVLELYRAGLKVPDDVTLVWPDDNHGYIRHFPTARERARDGGSGIYYHVSYLGSPLSYLWLSTTPPAVIWSEMSKAYALGARELWILNVGDIKPAEVSIELFLQMAWDIDRWNVDTLDRFLVTWAAREFGPEQAEEIAEIMCGYYRLNFQRRPEHLQWWLPHSRERGSPLTTEEADERLAAFASLAARAEAVEARLPSEMRDAFYQLVLYPVAASDAANQVYFYNERYGRLFNAEMELRGQYGLKARLAHERIEALTHRYNHEIAGGKWQRFMAPEPADNMWRSYRTAVPILPAEGMVDRELRPELFPAEDVGGLLDKAREQPSRFVEHDGIVAMEAEHFSRAGSIGDAAWAVVPELGRTGDAVTVLPVTTASTAPGEGAWLEYDFATQTSGDATLTIYLLPTFPIDSAHGLRLAVSVDGGEPQPVELVRETGDTEWKQAVLNASVQVSLPLNALQAGPHRLRLHQVDPGVVVDKLVVHFGELPGSYLGPKETVE